MSRRIGGAGGGSDKGSGNSGRVVAGAVAAVTIASAGGGIGAGTVGGSASSSSVQSVAGKNLNAKKADARRSAGRGNADEAWQRMGLRLSRKHIEKAATCAVNSFGQVREFFLRTPCRSLDRMLFAVGDGQGNVAVVAVAWVDFRTRGDARRFKDLDDVFGTGNVTPLGGAVLGLADVRFTGRYYGSHRTGTVTVIAEAESVAGHVDGEVLDAVAEVAVFLPRP